MIFLTSLFHRRELPTTGPRMVQRPIAAAVSAIQTPEVKASKSLKDSKVRPAIAMAIDPIRMKEEIDRQKNRISNALLECVSPDQMNSYLIEKIAKEPSNPIEIAEKEYCQAIKADLDKLEFFDDRVAHLIDNDLVMLAILGKHHVDPIERYRSLRRIFLDTTRIPLAPELVLSRLGFKSHEIRKTFDLIHPRLLGSADDKIQWLEAVVNTLDIPQDELKAIFDHQGLELKFHPKKPKDLTFGHFPPSEKVTDLFWENPGDVGVIADVKTIMTNDEIYESIIKKLLDPKTEEDEEMLDELAFAFGVDKSDLNLATFSDDELVECARFFVHNFSKTRGPVYISKEPKVEFDVASFAAETRPSGSILTREHPPSSGDGRLVILPKEGPAPVIGRDAFGEKRFITRTLSTPFRPVAMSDIALTTICQEIAMKLIDQLAQ